MVRINELKPGDIFKFPGFITKCRVKSVSSLGVNYQFIRSGTEYPREQLNLPIFFKSSKCRMFVERLDN